MPIHIDYVDDSDVLTLKLIIMKIAETKEQASRVINKYLNENKHAHLMTPDDIWWDEEIHPHCDYILYVDHYGAM